jgi:hypothetical protein
MMRFTRFHLPPFFFWTMYEQAPAAGFHVMDTNPVPAFACVITGLSGLLPTVAATFGIFLLTSVVTPANEPAAVMASAAAVAAAKSLIILCGTRFGKMDVKNFFIYIPVYPCTADIKKTK